MCAVSCALASLAFVDIFPSYEQIYIINSVSAMQYIVYLIDRPYVDGMNGDSYTSYRLNNIHVNDMYL